MKTNTRGTVQKICINEKFTEFISVYTVIKVLALVVSV